MRVGKSKTYATKPATKANGHKHVVTGAGSRGKGTGQGMEKGSGLKGPSPAFDGC